jgi:tetratricopeptide (TPR) repeat protein
VLVETFVGWLLEEVAGLGVRSGLRALRGSPNERSLRRVLDLAVRSASEQVPEPSRRQLMGALAERFSAPPTVEELDRNVDLREGIRRAFHAQLAPLADPTLTGTGRSFLQEIGLDGARLAVQMTDAFVDSLRRLAAAGDPASFALLLGLEEVQSEVHSLRRSLALVPAAALNSLPRDTMDFTDREEALSSILDHQVSRSDGCTPVIAIDGMPGVGKTVLAVRAAHRFATDYPDARLFLDLHAYSADRAPVTPEAALETLLRALGLASEQIPDTLDERASLWRSELTQKRALVVFDDAIGPGQVRPLLPASSRCLVVVTSRRRLSGLEGTETVSLNVLPADDGVRLFRRVVGYERTRDQVDEVRQTVALCGHLPLAIRIVAARLHQHVSWRVSDLLTELIATHDRLSEIHEGDVDVLAAFELSYHGLPPDQRQMFRLLGLHPGQDFSLYAAAALAGTDLRTARGLVEGLLYQHLVEEPHHGRFELHDLLHEYARRLTQEEDTPSDRNVALDRLLDFYITMATRVDHLINLLGRRDGGDVEWPPAATPNIASHPEAITWAEMERQNLLACLQIALDSGRRKRAVSLARGMAYFLRLKGYWSEALNLYGRIESLCSDIGDIQGAADMRFLAGDIYRLTRRHVEALQNYETALANYRQIGDRHQEARTLHSIGDIERTGGRFADALHTYEGAQTVYRELGNQQAEARALHSIADAYRLSGQLDEALAHYSRLVEPYETLKDHVGQARVRFGIGEIYRLTSRYEEAVAESMAALDSFKELGDRLGEADALNSLGGTHLESLDYASASRCFDEARTMYEELQDRQGEARALRGRAELALRAGHENEAVAHLRRALTHLDLLDLPEAEEVRAEIARIETGGPPDQQVT